MSASFPSLLPRSASVPLGFVLVAQVAAREGVRILLLKGPGLVAQGLRQQRTSVDVDVWAEPGRHQDLLLALAKHGWYWRPIPERGARLTDLHSVTLIHDQWPNDIDAHSYFPGFLGPTEQIFEALWAERENIEIAGQLVPVPSKADHALLEVLHRLRAGEQGLTDPRITYLVELLNEDAELSQRLFDRSEELAARDSAAPLLRTLGFDVPEPQDPSPALLRWRAQSEGLSVGTLLVAVRSAPWSKRAGIFWFGIFPTPTNLFRTFPRAGRNAFVAYWSGWWTRARRGLRQLARVPSFLRRYQRVQTLDSAWRDLTPVEELLPATVQGRAESASAAQAQVQAETPLGEELDHVAWAVVDSIAHISISDGRTFVLDPSSLQPMELSGSGAWLWPLLCAGHTISELAVFAAEQEGQKDAHAAILEQIRTFTQGLVTRGVLTQA